MPDTLRRMRAYLAAPLFNEMERAFNLQVASYLEPHIDIFLPQRDGGLLMNYIKDGVPPKVAAERIFQTDIAAMQNSDFLIAVLDGLSVDEGVSFELGYMFAVGKVCIGLQTDMRRALPTGNNPMIESSLSVVCQSISDLGEWVVDHINDAVHHEPSRMLKPAKQNNYSR